MADASLPGQAQAYDAEGAPIAPEETAAAVRAGKAFFQQGAKVFARNPQGALVTVAPEDAGANGYHVLSPTELAEARLKREAETASGLAKTGAEGLVRGATMGFAGPEQFYDAEGRARARARQQYNPNLSAGSEVAGMLGATVASGLLTGGAGAEVAGEVTAGRLASLAARGALTPFRAASALGDAAEVAVGGARLGEGLLGAAAKLGARGAAEGAAMGAGHEVSQAALENVPLTAERLLAGAWDGAKMGGAFGAGLGVLGHGLGKAGRSIVGKMAEEGKPLGDAVGSWAERAAFKQQVGNQGKFFDQATKFGRDEAGPARIGRKLLDANVSTKDRVAIGQVEGLRRDALGRMQSVVKAVDDAGVATNPRAILATIDDQIAKLKETPFGDAQALAERMEKQIAPFRARYAAATETADDLDQLGVQNFRYARDGMRPESLEHARKAYQPGANFADELGNSLGETDRLVSLGGLGPDAPPPGLKLSELWDLRKSLDESINFEAAQRGPAKQALMDMRSAFVAELDDTIARAAEQSGMDPKLLGAWKKATEDYGDMALIEKGLKGLIKQRGKNRAISPSDYAAGSLMALLTGGNPISGMAMGAASAGVHQLLRERGLGVMAKIADRSGLVAGKMENAAKVAAMVEKPAKIGARASGNLAQQFKHYSDLLTEAKTEPDKLARRLGDATADLSLRFPEVANQVNQTMLGDVAYLDSLHPQPASRKSATLTPAALKVPVYSFDQKTTFVEAAEALDNPVGVFEDIARGNLPLAGLNALRARRPELYSEMRQTVVKYTLKREDELPFNRRMLLGVAFDFKSDWSMAHVSDIQRSLTVSAEPQSPHNPTAAPSKVGTDPGANISPGQF